LQSQEVSVSLPVVQNYVVRSLAGDMAAAIKMEGNIIVDGIHRYVAGLLTNLMLCHRFKTG
jgi:filamentous hemagglutinin